MNKSLSAGKSSYPEIAFKPGFFIRDAVSHSPQLLLWNCAPDLNIGDFENSIICGDCVDILKTIPDNSIDLIFTSPPYADQRKNTYGGIHADDYVKWFLPKSTEFLRVLKPTGSFVLNIKERVVNGERHTYVIDLIKDLRNQGWYWTEEYMWHKKNSHPGK